MRYQKIVLYNSIITFYAELNKNTEKSKKKKKWKSGPTWIRTHDPPDSRLKARQGIYSTIISARKLRFFPSSSQVRKAISKALYALSPH